MALLSYPLPLMPVVQLLSPSRALAPDDEKEAEVRHRWRPHGEDGIRLSLLTLTTAIALLVPNFGAIAGFLGCINLANSALLPPLIHLRLVTLQRARGAP